MCHTAVLITCVCFCESAQAAVHISGKYRPLLVASTKFRDLKVPRIRRILILAILAESVIIIYCDVLMNSAALAKIDTRNL